MSIRFFAGLVGALILSCQANAQTTKPANVATGDAARVAALRNLEQQIENAISNRDRAFVEMVTAPSFVFTHSDGKVDDRAKILAGLGRRATFSEITSRIVDPQEQRVELHGDVALTRGKLDVRGARRSYRISYVRLYRWQPRGWRMLSHYSTGMEPLSP